ncbi:MAG: phosphoglucosamine mutase [Candidatus Micrarchaeia archaeon]
MALSFGTNGVRGLFDSLGPAESVSLGRAFGAYVISKRQKKGGARPRIAVARDHRLTSPILHSACISGALSSGIDVLDLGLCSSPTAEIMVHKLALDGAIIVTASHNPPEWNALKFVDWDGVAISRERGQEISAMSGSAQHDIMKLGSLFQTNDASLVHKELVLSNVDRKAFSKKRLKIVLDCANGTAALVAPFIFSELGCAVITLNSHIDGHFPGRLSEPTEANLSDLKAAVVSTGADLGVAFDGDSDRVVFIDELGRWIVGDKGLAISLRIAIDGMKASKSSPKSKKVFTTVATSRVFEDVAKTAGLECVYTRVGAPYLSEDMSAQGAFFGGEEVGGIVWPEVSLAKDGFLAAAKIAQAVCSKPLSKYLDELPKYYNSKTKVAASPAQKKKAVEFMKGLAPKGAKKTAIDGVRLDFPDSSWVIVRASGTENYLRIFAEAQSGQAAKKLMSEYEAMIRKEIS